MDRRPGHNYTSNRVDYSYARTTKLMSTHDKAIKLLRKTIEKYEKVISEADKAASKIQQEIQERDARMDSIRNEMLVLLTEEKKVLNEMWAAEAKVETLTKMLDEEIF